MKAPLTDDDVKKVRKADLHYLNDRFRESTDLYIKVIVARDSKLAMSDEYGLLIKAAKAISKLDKPKEQDTKNLKNIIKKLIDDPQSFPEDISDRMLLLAHAPDSFYSKYYEFLSKSSPTALRMLATISYDAYFDNPAPKKSYNIFTAKAKYREEFFSFSELYNLDASKTDHVLKEMWHYGLTAQALVTTNRWGDTVAHRDIFWGSAQKALIYLEYTKRFPNWFLKKYLYELKNHQQENWLDDIARRAQEDDLTTKFIKLLSDKKLHHLTLLKSDSQPYLCIAAEQESPKFVQSLLSSVKSESEKIEVEQRIFNLQTLGFEKIYNSNQEMMALLREMGIREYHAEIDKDYEKVFVGDKQNVHRAEFAKPLVRAVAKLSEHYGASQEFIDKQCKDFEIFFHSDLSKVAPAYLLTFLHRQKCLIFPDKELHFSPRGVKKNDEQLIQEFLIGAESTLSRILDSRTFSHKYDKDSKKGLEPHATNVYKEFKLTHALAYAWTGLSDPAALDGINLTEEDLTQRKLLLPLVLYETYREGIQEYQSSKTVENQDEHINIVKKRITAEKKRGKEEEKEEMKEEEIAVSSTTQDMDSERSDSSLIISDSSESEKIKGVICATGVFDRIITILDRQHDLVKIEVIPDEMRITEQTISERIKSIEDDLLRSIPLLMLSRIYDNFENFKKNDLLQNFLPLQQYLNGQLKKLFKEQVEEHRFFGGIDDKAQREDFLVFERTMHKALLQNPVKLALDFISKNDGDYRGNALLLKIFLQYISAHEHFSISLKIELIKQCIEKCNHKAQIDNVDLALNLSDARFFNECKPIVESHIFYKRLNDIANKISTEISQKTKKQALSDISEIVRELASKQEWDIYDNMKFQVISSENTLFKQESIILDLCKHALLNDNLLMLRTVINKAESLFEKQVSLGEAPGSPDTYNNKYLKAIAEKDFGGGTTALHLVALKCNSKELINFILSYQEFRNKIDIPDHTGCTPFYTAVVNQNKYAVEKFIEYGADINIADNYGVTAIHIAAGQGDLNLVEHLIESGANPFATDNLRGTFIHRAALSVKEKMKANAIDALQEQLIKDLEVVPVSKDILPHFSTFITELLGNAGDYE